ncbi:MAG TPA: hypothetical protein PLH46_06085, partial [Caldisericia bacterium]|nr:hypothetical protein [Caldisericia bacterium]
IHILGSEQDIEGFKSYVNNKSKFLTQENNNSVQNTYTNHITYSQALEKARQFLPNFKEKDLKFVTEKMMDGDKLGFYQSGVVNVLSKNTLTTEEYILRHELFHKIFTEYLTKNEQKSLYNNFSKEFGEGLSLFEFEEQLALKFQSWKNKEIEVKSSVLKTLFNKILRFFGLIQANTKNLNELFKQIERGQLSVKKQEVTSTIKNLDKIINLYGSAKNFKELKEEMDSKINELQTVGAVNKRTYVYLDGIHSLFKKNKETPVYNDLLKQLKLENEITLIVPNILGKYVDYNYLINKAIAANENLSKESIKSIIDNYSEKRALQITELLKNPALEGVKEHLEKNYRNLTSKKFVETNESIFLNNHVNKREVIAILKKMFKEKYTSYKKELSFLLKDIESIKTAISSSTNEEELKNLNLQLEALEEQRRKLNTPLRKYMFITDNTNEGFTYLYESSYPKITEEDLLEARLYDINEFDEEIDGDPDTKSKEFAFDAETKNMKTSIASSAKIILSNIIDKEKINKEGTQGVKLPFGYSYVLAVKLMEGLDPSLSDFNKQIDKKFEALDGTSSMKAVANTIKTIYNESLRTNIKVGDKTYLLPINAKFLDDKTFIYSTANRDLSEVKTKDDVLKINKEDQNNGTIFIFKKRKNKEGHLEDTMTFTYRLLKEIEEQQYVFGITDSKTFPQHFDTGTKGMILMNRLYYKMISNITFVELMQNLLSQKEKNRYIGLTSVNKDGSVTSTYRAGMQRDANADMVKKVERALINNLNSKENIVKLRGSFFVHNNNFYKYFGAKTLGYDVQFKALKHFLEFIGYNKEELDKISINNFDDTKDKLKIRELYLDVYHFLYDNTSKNRLQSIVQFNSKVDEKIEKKRQYTEEEIEKLKEDESLTAIDIEERIKEGVSYFAEPELEDILEDNGSLLQKLAKFLSSNANNESQTMSVDAAGKKKNAHTVSSVAVDTLKRLEEGNLKLIEIENQSQYKYLYTPTYKHNIFNPVNPQKFNVIEKQIEDDGYKIKYGYGSNETKSFYTKETLKEFYTRTFNLAFLKVAEDSANKKLQYIQYLPIISNRPFAAGAKINMLNPIEIKKGLMAYVNQFISRPDLKGIEGYNKYSTVNFSIFEDALKSMDINKFSIDENTSEETKNQLVQQMYNRLHLRAIEVTKNILDNNVVLDTDLKKIATKLESYVDKSVYNFKKEDYKSSEKIRESVSSVKERVRKDIASGKLSIKEEELSKMNETDLMELGYFRGQILDIEKLLPLVSVFVLNTYVNSYFLDQITMGESSFFKNSTARIKRRQGVFAPGLKPIVHSKLGIDEHFNVMVVSDTVVDKLGEVNSIESFFKSLNISQELLDKLLKKFSKDGFNPADGQGLMLPERRDQIKQSIGLSYGLGNILKPAHYEVDEFGIPRMMKYSSIVLTDELVKEFPELGNVRQKMRENNAGEMIFESAFKVGAPKNKVNATELLTNPSYKIPEESIVKLNNHNYKLQLNPEHDIEDSKVAKPTQLSYFLSILNKNLPQAKQVYSAYSKITNLKLDAFTKILNVDEENKVDNKSFIDLLESSLEGGT